VEVGRRLIIVHLFEHFGHAQVGLETLLRLLFAPVQLAVFQCVHDVCQDVRSLLQSALCLLVQLLLFKQTFRGLDRGGC